MGLEYLTGTTVTLLNAQSEPAGDVVVENYLRSERSYKVWWTYPQTGEGELIKVPEWRLQKKKD